MAKESTPKQGVIPGLDHYAERQNDGKLKYIESPGWVQPPRRKRQRKRASVAPNQTTMWNDMA